MAQSYTNFEVIISDDASKDNTLEIVERFKAKAKFPVTVLHHKPQGIGANWNHCVKHANGTYIKFLFQDDVLHANCLEKMVAVLDANKNIGLVASKRHFINETPNDATIQQWMATYGNLQQQFEDADKSITVVDENLFKRQDFYASPLNKIGEPTTYMFRKDIINTIGYFDENLEQILDYVFCYRLLKHQNIAILNEALVSFRIHTNQATNVNRNKPIKDYEHYQYLLYKEFLPLLHPSFQKKLKSKYSNIFKLQKKLKAFVKRILK